MKHSAIRRVVPVGAVVALMLTAAACGGSKSSNNSAAARASTSSGSSASGSAAAAKSMTDVTYLTDFLSNGTYSPMWYGIKLGYYKAQGINLKIQYGTGSATTSQAIASGKADIGDAFSGTMAQAVAKGAPLESVGFFRANGGWAFYCDKKLGISTLKQMAGHSVILPPGTPQASLYKGVLNAVGVSPDSVKIQSVPSSAEDSTYATGKADCVGGTLGDAPNFLPLRASTVLPWSSGGFNGGGYNFFVTKSYLAANKQVIEGFLKATYQSIEASLKNPADAVAAFNAANPQAKPDLTKQQWAAVKPEFCTKDMTQQGKMMGYQLPAAWSDVVSDLQKYASLPSSVQASSLFTNEFFDQDNVSSAACTSDISG